MVYIPPSLSQIKHAARDAVSTLNVVCGPNAKFFFVGSFACRLYGDHVAPYMSGFRTPNDIDIVVETSYDQEELKRRIVQHNSMFFLVAAKTPGATYKVLKHCLRYSRLAVKVDVLVANVTLDIPTVPYSRVKMIEDFPTCPLSFLVLLRLQAWDHHRIATARHLYEKAAVDVRDLISYLLPFVRNWEWSGAAKTLMDDAATYLPAWFIDISRERAGRFIRYNPHSRTLWKAMGVIVERGAGGDDLGLLIGRLRLYD